MALARASNGPKIKRTVPQPLRFQTTGAKRVPIGLEHNKAAKERVWCRLGFYTSWDFILFFSLALEAILKIWTFWRGSVFVLLSPFPLSWRNYYIFFFILKGIWSLAFWRGSNSSVILFGGRDLIFIFSEWDLILFSSLFLKDPHLLLFVYLLRKRFDSF